jgi:hypothetical protein
MATEDKLRKLGFSKFRKTEPVWAKKMDKAFTCDTKEGDNIRGKKGDYLCIGIDGEMWPVDASIFERTYEELK